MVCTDWARVVRTEQEQCTGRVRKFCTFAVKTNLMYREEEGQSSFVNQRSEDHKVYQQDRKR